jgi:hypothetical protein
MLDLLLLPDPIDGLPTQLLTPTGQGEEMDETTLSALESEIEIVCEEIERLVERKSLLIYQRDLILQQQRMNQIGKKILFLGLKILEILLASSSITIISVQVNWRSSTPLSLVMMSLQS